jgi:hypothetical protein
MTQAPRHGGRAGDPGRRHDLLDAPPCGRPAPTPQPNDGELGVTLRDPQLEKAIDFANRIARQRHLTNDAALPRLS